MKTNQHRPGGHPARRLAPLGCAGVLIGLVVAAPPGRAEADGPDFFRVTGVAADDVLNIRAAPDARAGKVGEIPPGADGLRNRGCKGGLGFADWQAATEAEREAAARDRWCRVVFEGVEGWAAARFLAEGSAPAPAAAEADDPVPWRLVAVNGAPVEGKPEIGFARDGAISGSTGCNRFQARGRMEDGSLVVEDPVATTRMACSGAMDAQESRILSAMQGRIAVAFDPLTGRLGLSNAGVTLTLMPGTAQGTEEAAHGFSPAPGEAAEYWSVVGVDSHLNLRAEASAGAAVLAQLLPGSVLRNAGCREGDARRWCEVETLDGTQTRGWVAADYLESAGSALRAGQDIFDAIGHLPCAQAAGQPTVRCEFGVARDGGGSATVVVIGPDAQRRALFFENGTFLSADTSQADGYPDSSAAREGDLIRVRVGAERYEIPDAVLYGG
ncbi:Heat shock protein HslJ [Rhodovulum sp. ES.010]|uniref:SH3 domain-containing protein n=1 Tax=Rhodovulum sp. ES.010 TaxID=1882821 RepID=UPI0009298E77|nr:SH3 domain-containing protein [Rhodovulum sp. ES.010]SIO47781.1 Heat shock protein HslJ [Rhodovulum sp. ES.010]